MTAIHYLDFELTIDVGSNQRYPVTVLRAPGGEARATMQFPFDETQLAAQLAPIQDALIGQAPHDALRLMREFGTALFDALLTGEVRSRFDVSRNTAKTQKQGLRIKLRILAPEMLGVPWEFLYDPRKHEFVCLSSNTPIVRYTEAPQSTQPLAVQPPLRILGLVTNPQGVPELDVEREKQRIEQAIALLQQQKLVELVWLDGQTPRALQGALQNGTWHVFHYVGHAQFDPGSGEGVLALADEQGQLLPLGPWALARLLDDHESLRLAVLNACEGARGDEFPHSYSLAAMLVRRGMPAVIAMQYAITDVAALEFTRSFYDAIANRLPVDTAVAEARKAISIHQPNSLEWATPVLYMRSPDGHLFDIPAPPPPPPPPVLNCRDVLKSALSLIVKGDIISALKIAKPCFPIWQSIGAIIIVLALFVALGTWFWPDIGDFISLWPPTSTPTLIAQASDTPAPAPTFTNTSIATPTPTSTSTPTPTPDCSKVEVTALQLITQTYPVTTNMDVYPIPLPDTAVSALNGRAILSPTTDLPEGCTCKWEVRTDENLEWQPVPPQPRSCNTFLLFPEDVGSLELKLTIGGQQPSIEKTFVIHRAR